MLPDEGLQQFFFEPDCIDLEIFRKGRLLRTGDLPEDRSEKVLFCEDWDLPAILIVTNV